jgi:hypothetical protein
MLPPKRLTFTTPLRRDQRTLIWLQDQDPSISWSRWDGIVSSLDDYHRWDNNDERIVGAVLLSVEGEADTFLEDLYSVSKDIPMIMLSRDILSLKSEEFWSDNFDNVVCLEDMLVSYPFLRTEWNGSVVDAIAIFSIIFRYNRLFGVKRTLDNTNPNMEAVERRLSYFHPHITLCCDGVPEETWLFTQFFIHSQRKRSIEIKDSLIKNIKSPYIDKIVLLNETDMSHVWKSMPGAEKITQVVIGKRLSYYDVLNYISESVPMNVITIIANADMYYDSTLQNLWKIKLEDRMLALLRWEDDTKDLFGPLPDLQDTWILSSNSVKSRTWDPTVFDFTFGQLGCDNAFAGHMLRQRFVLYNPALTIKSFHIHTSGVRDYSIKNAVKSDLYIQLEPTHLLDTKQDQVPSGVPQHICNELVTFEIQSSSLSNEITYCNMLSKEGRYRWEAQEQNRYFEPAIPVYLWNHASVTPNGLVYEPYTIYTGKYASDERYQYWNNAHVDIFTPLQYANQMIAVPFADVSVFAHPDTYILQYVSRANRILELFPDASMSIPQGYDTYLNVFTTPYQGITHSDTSGCWAESVVGFLPGPLSSELGREDVMTLRNGLRSGWPSAPIAQICVVVVDDSVITPRFVFEHINPWLNKKDSDWTVRIVSKQPGVYDQLLGASLCILFGGPSTQTRWSKLWALPCDCCVVEFQQELALDGEFQHLCHISDWKSWLLFLAKGSNADVQQQIMEQLEKWYSTFSYELLLIEHKE